MKTNEFYRVINKVIIRKIADIKAIKKSKVI